MTSMVIVSHLKKTYDTQVVIDDLSFSVPRAGRVAVFAPSGAGKTTLIEILAGLQKPDEGTFQISAHRPAVIFQEPRLFPYMTVEENILLPFKIQGRNGPELKDYETWLSICGLDSFRLHYPYQLSGGMKQKVSFIRGILQNPDFLVMDEPFQSIGRQSKQAIINHLLNTHPDVTLLLITHDPEEVKWIAHTMLYFHSPVLDRYAIVNTTDPSFETFRRSDLSFLEVM